MSIIQKIKHLLSTDEAHAVKDELLEQTGELVDKTKRAMDGVAEKGKQVASAVANTVEHISGQISYETFKQIEVRVGTILSVEKIEKSNKLLLLQVDIGQSQPRQIVSGIAMYFEDEQSLVNRQAMFVTNLDSRMIFGHESNGMIFALNDEHNFSILEPDMHIAPGTLAS